MFSWNRRKVIYTKARFYNLTFVLILKLFTSISVGKCIGDHYSITSTFQENQTDSQNRFSSVNNVIYLGKFIERLALACNVKSVAIICDDTIFKTHIVKLFNRLGIPAVHDKESHKNMSQFLDKVYIRNNVEYFVIANSKPHNVLNKAEAAFLDDSRGRLAVMPHQTHWIVVCRTLEQYREVTSQQSRSILDNVATFQVKFHEQSWFSTWSSPLLDDINAVTTFMWRSNRTREPSPVSWQSLAKPASTDMCRLFPNTDNGLNGRHLVVLAKGYFNAILRFTLSPENSTAPGIQEGLLIDVLQYSSEVMNFTYEFLPLRFPFSYKESWETYTELIMAKIADIGLSPWSILYSSADNFSLSYPFLFDEIIGVYRLPPEENVFASLFFLCPFPSFIYLLLFCSLIFVSLIYFTIVEVIYRSKNDKRIKSGYPCDAEKSSPRKNKNDEELKDDSKDLGTYLTKYFSVLFVFFAAIMNQGYLPRPQQTSSRVIVGVWAIGIVNYYATFSSYITAEMVKTKKELPFKTFQQLLKRDDYLCTVLEYSVVDVLISGSRNGTLAELKAKMKRFPVAGFSSMDKALDASLSSLRPKTVFIFYKSIVMNWLQEKGHPNDYVIMKDDPLLRSDLAIMFPYDSALNRLMSRTFLGIFESGIDQKLYNEFKAPWYYANKTSDIRKKGAVTIEVKDLLWLAIVCLLSVFLAVVTLGVELLVHRYRQN